MRTPKWWIAWMIVAVLTGSGLSVDPCHAGEVITNETILRTVGGNKVHETMKEHRRQIRDILDAFLTGDIKEIRKKAEMVADSMSRCAGDIPAPKGQEAAQLKLLAGVIEQAQIVWKAAQEDNYQEAYLHFSAMVGLCVQCHQGRRPWGTFPTWEPPSQESAPKQENEAPAPKAEGTASPP